METIKVENVKEAIEELYRKRMEAILNYKFDLQYTSGFVGAVDQSITILENLIVRRQRNEP